MLVKSFAKSLQKEEIDPAPINITISFGLSILFNLLLTFSKLLI